MTRTYWVVLEWTGKNFSGYAPDVQGCIATAKTRDGVRNRLRSALEAHLAWLAEEGEPIPEASRSTTVDMTSDPEFPNPPGYYVVVEALPVKIPAKKQRPGTKRSRRQDLVAA